MPKQTTKQARQAFAGGLCERLDELLHEADMTAWQLARKVRDLAPGIGGKTAVGEWFCGDSPDTHRIPMFAAPVVAEALGCSVADLFPAVWTS